MGLGRDRRPRRSWVCAAVVVVGSLAACSSGDPVTTARPDASKFVLSAADFPTGWVAYPQHPHDTSGPPPTVDTKASFCGLRNPADTSDPLDRVLVGYSRNTSGPFVYETVAVYRSEAEAAAVFRTARATFQACARSGPGLTPPVQAEPVAAPSLGDQALGYQVATVSPSLGAAPATAMGAGSGSATTATTAMAMAGAAQTVSQRFYVTCTFSHRAIADPIVFPGAVDPAGGVTTTTDPDMPMDHGATMAAAGTEPGMPGHRHDFFGNTTTDANSTAASLAAGATSCSDDGDHSAYWVPTLYRDGAPVQPTGARIWYSLPTGATAGQVTVPPNGLQLIGGSPAATAAQSTAVVGWRCGQQLGPLSTTPPDTCTTANPLTYHVKFANCWNGTDLASHDHHAHMADDDHGACPADHPVLLPEIELAVDTGLSGRVGKLSLAMGGMTGLHGDAFLSWTDGKLGRLMVRCFGDATVDCSNGDGAPGFTTYASAFMVRKGRSVVFLANADMEALDLDFGRRMVKTAVAKVPADPK